MKKIALFTTSLLVICISSCQMGECGFSKDQFLSNYYKVIDNVKDKSRSELKDDWEKMDSKMEKLILECYDRYEKDLTPEEDLKFWLSSLTYYVKRHGLRILNKLDKDEDEVYVKIKEHLENIDADIEFDGEQFFEEFFGEDFEKLVEDLTEDIEKWGERFKTMFGIDEE